MFSIGTYPMGLESSTQSNTRIGDKLSMDWLIETCIQLMLMWMNTQIDTFLLYKIIMSIIYFCIKWHHHIIPI